MLKGKVLTEPLGVQRIKACTWLPVTELEQINRLRGDISISLWIRRAIQNALSEGEGTNQTPKAAVVVPNTTPTPQGSSLDPKEVEV
jgi:hypothetical protein